jgi:hypothetical protein
MKLVLSVILLLRATAADVHCVLYSLYMQPCKES